MDTYVYQHIHQWIHWNHEVLKHWYSIHLSVNLHISFHMYGSICIPTYTSVDSLESRSIITLVFNPFFYQFTNLSRQGYIN